MFDPFSDEQLFTESKDEDLIQASLEGNRIALEQLLARHQYWIYNLAFRLVSNPEDAQDITQEIIIKLMTKLSSYDPEKAAFRTWLYRIVMNHFLNMKRQKLEEAITGFDAYGSALDQIPDEQLTQSVDQPMLVEEAKIGCMAGMLLCLERNQRLVYILSTIFEIPHTMGAEIMDLKDAHYRKLLSRARERLHQFMNHQCSLVHPERACKCRNKTRGFIRNRWVDPNHFIFYRGKQQTVKDILHHKLSGFDEDYYQPYMDLYQKQPMYEPADLSTWLKKILQQESFQELFHLN